jgi:uncharacterized membrane protein
LRATLWIEHIIQPPTLHVTTNTSPFALDPIPPLRQQNDSHKSICPKIGELSNSSQLHHPFFKCLTLLSPLPPPSNPRLNQSLISSFLYSLWAIFSKLSQTKGGLSPVESQVITILTMTALALNMISDNYAAVRVTNLPLMGTLLAVGAGVLTTQGGAYYSAALKTGDGSTVAAICGTYPAVSFVSGDSATLL